MAVALFGGAFDPPHLGHVAVALGAKVALDVESLLVLVGERPGHKDVVLPVETRVELARAAFPGDEVRLDPYPRTVDLLRAERFDDPYVVVGADQLAAFASWKEPAAVLGLARLAVATRPGHPREELDALARASGRPGRVLVFEIEPVPVSSSEVRRLAAEGAPLDGLVPDRVAALIRERGLYRTG